VQPQDGNTVVPVNQPVTFQVRIDGKVPEANKPDALRLKFRYSSDEPVYQERPLEPTDGTRDWGVRLPGFEVKNGFWYKIAGGDAETPEYRVEVRSTPLITRFEVKYHYRPYLHRKDRNDTAPALADLRGTEVTLIARTNRNVKDGLLHFQVFEGEQALQPIKAELLPNHPDALRFRLVLDRDALYRIRFTSMEGEESGESIQYPIRVYPDKAPQVVLTKPGEDITLPADGTLALEGSATDDFGLTDLTLRMQMKGGPKLQPKVYRGDEKKGVGQSLFRFDDGTFPRQLDYKDFVELPKLKDEQGRPVRLKPGDEIEYWLEAADNCDYPQVNIGRTERTYVVKIAKPADDPQKQQEQRKQLEQEQKKHQDKQNQELQKENQQKQEQAKAAEQQQQQKNDLEREAEKLQQQLDKDQKGNNKPQELQPEDKGQQKNPGQQNGENQPGQDKGQPKDKPNPQQQAELKPEGKDGQQNPKNPQGDKGQQKPDGGDKGNDPNQQAGADKPQDKSQQGKGPGEPKDANGKPDAGQQQPSGKPKDKGDGKPGDQPGEGKKEGNPQQKADAGAAKGAQQEKPGQAKGDQTPQPGGNGKPDDKKPTRQVDKGQEKKEDAGARSSSGPKGDNKTAGSQSAKESASAKPDGGEGSGGQAGNSGTKPNAQTGSGSSGSNNQGNGNSGTKPGQDATAKDVQAKADSMNGGGSGKKDAVRDLQNMAQNAKDPQVRQAAKDALEKAGEPVGAGPAKDDSPKPDSQQEGAGKPIGPDDKQPNGDNKQGGTDDPKIKGTPKEADPQASKTNRPPQGDAKEGTGSQGSDNSKMPPPDGKREPGKTPGTGSTPGGAESGERTDDADGPANQQEVEQMQNDLRDKLRAGDLLLRRMKEVAKDKDALRRLNRTPQETDEFIKKWQQQMKDWQEQLKELDQTPKGPGGPTTYSSGPRKIKPTGQGRDPLQSVGPLQPPAEFEKSTREFSQEISRIKPKREK
jgi:hypothetical protein